LKQLFENTQSALDGMPFSSTSAHSGLYELHHRYRIPQKRFFELLQGFALDVQRQDVVTSQDLLSYCYHVAGVVGIMMCPILGTEKPEALRLADSLGRAMQMTNIARDIAEDHKLGRIYLPQDWLKPYGLSFANLLGLKEREALYACVLKLLSLADAYYEEGRRGLAYLPWRAAWSISVASVLYQRIGWKVRKIGGSAIDRRTILTPFERLTAVAVGTKQYLTTCLLRKNVPFTRGLEQ
jgi:phytoene synthase